MWFSVSWTEAEEKVWRTGTAERDELAERGIKGIPGWHIHIDRTS